MKIFTYVYKNINSKIFLLHFPTHGKFKTSRFATITPLLINLIDHPLVLPNVGKDYLL
jgi:hypothetical protein